jgi:methionyl-tRNA formyltransferase
VNTLEQIVSWDINATQQIEADATYCTKISKSDGEINWDTSAESIYNKYKAYTPLPWIYSFYKWKKISIEKCEYVEDDNYRDENFKLWDVVEYEHAWKHHICVLAKEWMIQLEKIKLEWKQSMDIFSFVNGNKDFLDYNFQK